MTTRLIHFGALFPSILFMTQVCIKSMNCLFNPVLVVNEISDYKVFAYRIDAPSGER